MKERKLVCIMCPNGCEMNVVYGDKEIEKLEGNTCPKGREYAENECFHPVRTITSTVRCENGKIVAVRTSDAVPKELIFKVMEAINALRPKEEDAAFGNVLLHGVCGTSADVVVTGVNG